MYPSIEILSPKYKLTLEAISKENGCKAKVEELAFIDIAFCCVYFGLAKESEPILLHKFFHRYNKEFASKLRTFLQLKPKMDSTGFKFWKNFKQKSINEMRRVFEDIHNNKRSGPSDIHSENLYDNLSALKYYGGHQHRLSHYFRHLYQSFRFISMQQFLTSQEKYFYGKTIRAQLSVYEQIIILLNSLSSLGMKWEFTANIKDLPLGNSINDFRFITRYNLIKNLPGSQYYDIKYRKFYPLVAYDYLEDVTYRSVV
jgi:hypothetical protein